MFMPIKLQALGLKCPLYAVEKTSRINAGLEAIHDEAPKRREKATDH